MNAVVRFQPKVPTMIRDRVVEVIDNVAYVNGKVVDPDASFIASITDQHINPWIERFSSTYIVDVTARCNMVCKYCYYKVDNDSIDRSAESVIVECMKSGFDDICLMGAEPTMRDDLFKIIRFLTQHGKRVGMTTNGKRFEEEGYAESLVAAGLKYVNYSMHFTKAVKPWEHKVTVLKAIKESGLRVCQLSFTVSTIAEMLHCMDVIRFLVGKGMRPDQFVIRAGAAMGACTRASGLFMSDMGKAALAYGAQKMADGGSNLYYLELIYCGRNLHIVCWPDNDSVTAYSKTGPVFGTVLGPMHSPLHQVVQAMTPEQIAQETKVLLPETTDRIVHEVERDFGKVWAVERESIPGKIWLHSRIDRWTLNERLQCKEIWPVFLEELKRQGYSEVFSCIPDGDIKLRKWQERHGLVEIGQLDGTLIFRREI